MNIVFNEMVEADLVDLDIPAELHKRIMLSIGSSEFYTMRVEDGRIIGISGFSYMWDGVYEAWIRVTDLAREYPIALVRASRKRVFEFATTHKVHRIQATTLNGSSRNKRFIKMLGFVGEAVLKRYGPMGDDFIMCRYEITSG